MKGKAKNSVLDGWCERGNERKGRVRREREKKKVESQAGDERPKTSKTCSRRRRRSRSKCSGRL